MLDKIDSTHLALPHVVEALGEVARAHRLGDHLVYAELDLLEKAKDLPSLSESARASFLFMRNRFSTTGPYLSRFNVRLSIVPDDNILEVNTLAVNGRSIEEISISARLVANSNILRRTVLLGENHSDTEFYRIVASTYKASEGISGISIQFDPNGGGGGSTVDEYKHIQDSISRTCLCILDSDRHYPTDSIGGTAQNVLNEDNPNIPTSKVIVTDTLEMENLIPTIIVERLMGLGSATCRPLQAHKNIAASAHGSAMQYVDYKKGLKLFELTTGSPSSDHLSYWKPVAEHVLGTPVTHTMCPTGVTCTKKSCRCILIPGYGDSIMDKVMSLMDSEKNTPMTHWVDAAMQSEWRRIGAVILDWCCGSSLRAI
ncbi:hypothetical protein [Deinococcus maricopensis]|nr:hypothetical protein [Deinococcus maricopensis]